MYQISDSNTKHIKTLGLKVKNGLLYRKREH